MSRLLCHCATPPRARSVPQARTGCPPGPAAWALAPAGFRFSSGHTSRISRLQPPDAPTYPLARAQRPSGVYCCSGTHRRHLLEAPPNLNSRFLRNGMIMVVLVVVTGALLYALIQPAASGTHSLTAFEQAVKAGQVKSVTRTDTTLNVTE